MKMDQGEISPLPGAPDVACRNADTEDVQHPLFWFGSGGGELQGSILDALKHTDFTHVQAAQARKILRPACLYILVDGNEGLHEIAPSLRVAGQR